MKKNQSAILSAAFVLLLPLCLLLGGCGQSKTVPDSYIEAEIQDFIDRPYSGPRSDPDSYRFTVSHSPDQDSHTDRVDVTITFS